MTKREAHTKLMDELMERYNNSEKEYFEFVMDGPSDWDLYEKSFPKILFLVKEARNGYHPSKPFQKVNTKFMRNIARWSLIIEKAFEQVELPLMPENSILREYNDSVAIVEVKKINQEKISSTSTDIDSYAYEDRAYLKAQIELLDPHVILCGGTLDCFDIIHEHNYEFQEKLFSIKNTSVWKVDSRLVIGFKHPSIFGKKDPSENDRNAFDNLKDLLSSEIVNQNIRQIKINNLL